MKTLKEASTSLVKSWWKNSDYRKMSAEECAFIDALNSHTLLLEEQQNG